MAEYILSNQRTPPPQKIGFVVNEGLQLALGGLFSAHRRDEHTDFGMFKNADSALEWVQTS